MNNDELIAAGHELAKCLDSNTPLIDIAKMLSKMATQLDVTTAALREKTKQCDALATENALLKAGVKYFSYSEMAGFEEHSTADLAQKSADADLAGERDEASSEGWSEETDTICWGVILQKAVENKFEKPSEENGWNGWSDYALLPNIETPATDAFLREVRASFIPEGYALVPQQIFLEPSDIESICSQCGDGHESGYGDFTDGLLWVGDIQRDDGSIVHGLHISSADYSEEGGVTVCEFAAQLRQGGAA
nr:hypothetical protein [Cronobacter sakazakii]